MTDEQRDLASCGLCGSDWFELVLDSDDHPHGGIQLDTAGLPIGYQGNPICAKCGVPFEPAGLSTADGKPLPDPDSWPVPSTVMAPARPGPVSAYPVWLLVLIAAGAVAVGVAAYMGLQAS